MQIIMTMTLELNRFLINNILENTNGQTENKGYFNEIKGVCVYMCYSGFTSNP